VFQIVVVQQLSHFLGLALTFHHLNEATCKDLFWSNLASILSKQQLRFRLVAEQHKQHQLPDILVAPVNVFLNYFHSLVFSARKFYL
jgi:hypothetical protein